MVEDRTEIRGGRHIDGGLRGDLGIVRQEAGVVEQLLSIDGGLGDVLKAQHEKLQRLPMVDREQLPQRTRHKQRLPYAAHIMGTSRQSSSPSSPSTSPSLGSTSRWPN